MVFLSTVEFCFFLHRGGARHFGGGRLSLYGRVVIGVASACDRVGVGIFVTIVNDCGKI